MDRELIIIIWKAKFNLDFGTVTWYHCFDSHLSTNFNWLNFFYNDNLLILTIVCAAIAIFNLYIEFTRLFNFLFFDLINNAGSPFNKLNLAIPNHAFKADYHFWRLLILRGIWMLTHHFFRPSNFWKLCIVSSWGRCILSRSEKATY